MAEQAAVTRKNQKVGQVVSTKMAKTIVVEVSRRVPHPVYKRIISKRKKFYAHDEQGLAGLAARLNAFAGPLFARIAINAGEPPRVLPERDGGTLKRRFRAALSLEG